MEISINGGKTVYAFIQARMNSQRLPGKVMKPLAGKSLLEWSLERAGMIHRDVRVVVITGSIEANRPIIEWCGKNGVECFVGSEEDVLNRFRRAADSYDASDVIRLTADNPLFDYDAARALLAVHLTENAEYSSNKSEVGSGLPDGIGVEIFSAETLAKLDGMSLSRSDREHVNDYILGHPDEFERCYWLTIPQDCSAYRFTIDTREDFEQVLDWISGHHTEDVRMPDYWRKIVRQ
ncbi:MAG: acylneuraminate cytidylyltransferase [Nitrospirota bacterium]